MSLAEFYELISKCSPGEIDRLRSRYRRYYREHRQVFTDLLVGKFTSEDSFKEALLDARIAASISGKTSAQSVNKIRVKSYGGFARTNERKLIKLATRILYLRMTGGMSGLKQSDETRGFKTTPDSKIRIPCTFPMPACTLACLDKLLRMQCVTEVTGFTRGWVYVLIREGKFPPPVKVGKRAIRFRQSEVEDWIATQK